VLSRPPHKPPAVDAGKQRRRRAQKAASARRGRRDEFLLRGLLVTPAMRKQMARLGHILDREVDDREAVERALIELVLRGVLHMK
jgi:hypothetical protein